MQLASLDAVMRNSENIFLEVCQSTRGGLAERISAKIIPEALQFVAVGSWQQGEGIKLE
jgi:hypothetical protein